MRHLVDTSSLPTLNISVDTLMTVRNWLHGIQTITTLLTLCMVIPVITTESKFYGGSQPGPNYTLFVTILSFGTPAFLVYFPWVYDKSNKFVTLGKFCYKPRTNIIFSGFFSLLWASAGIASVVHANNPSHCSIDSNLQKTFGNDYVSAWSTQCNLARATAAFAWLTCLLWLGTLIIASIRSYNENQESVHTLKEQMKSRQEWQEQQEQAEAQQGKEAYGDYYRDEEERVENEPLHQSPPSMSSVPQTDYYAQQPVSSVRFNSQPTYAPMPMPEPASHRF